MAAFGSVLGAAAAAAAERIMENFSEPSRNCTHFSLFRSRDRPSPSRIRIRNR